MRVVQTRRQPGGLASPARLRLEATPISSAIETARDMTEPCDLTALAARAMIGRKQLSPVELLESCIARIEAVDPAVNAMVARDYDGARRAAGRAEAAVASGQELQALHGLPLGIKDLTATA